MSEEVIERFSASKIDGDLLLLLTEENLRDDFNMNNGIARRKYVSLFYCWPHTSVELSRLEYRYLYLKIYLCLSHA